MTRQKSTVETTRNNRRMMGAAYHETAQNRRLRYKRKSLHLTPQSILYCNYLQSAINSLLLTLARCNQFFILNNSKVQLIINCYLRQSVINSLFFIASKWD